MKNKKIIGLIATVMIVAVAAWNISFSSKADSMLSDVALANIEALADTEISKGDPCYKGSYNSALPLAVKCGTPCSMDHVGGLTDKCS